jgi:ElaB/YqjD/DUF883 family membrane-anchored ribosome-binding protein
MIQAQPIKTAQARPDNTKERLYAEFNAVVAETEQLLASVASAGSGKAGALRANIEQSLAAAGDRIAKIRDEAERRAIGAAHAADDYVQDGPWRAVGIAAALGASLGLVAGLLIARR